MQKNKFKKIITLTYLTTILFSLFFPFNSIFAQNTNALVLSIDKSDLKIGEFAKVTVTNNLSNLVGGETVYFSSIGNESGLNPKTCVLPLPPLIPSCFVNYNSLIEGTFTLRANATLNGTFYESSVPVTIKNCPTGQILVSGICKDPIVIPPGEGTTTTTDTDTTYTPLAPLPGLPGEPYETDTDCPFGNYLNIIIKLVIGIAAVLAMVMIVMGGVEYMTSDLISSKESGKDTIRNAILGLLIALGAYLILNTINPQLLSVCLDNLPEATITINEPDAGDDTVDLDFAKRIYKYSTDASVSSGVTSAITKIKDGWEIVKFTVHTNNKMTIELKKGSTYDYTSVIDISPGLNGYASTGTGKMGDKKTPLGDWKIINIKYIPNQAQFNKKGSNMGAAFWHLDPTTSGERGIGMHGNKRGTLGPTIGCIRLKNADILALQPYIKVGILVSVKQ